MVWINTAMQLHINNLVNVLYTRLKENTLPVLKPIIWISRLSTHMNTGTT